MNKLPTLSVLIAVYKAEKTIERCLDSIFRQRDALANPDDVEVVAVNDASPDLSGEVLERYRAAHPALKIVTHSENLREAKTRNTGIENSCGEYFTFLDADDEYAPGAVLSILEAIGENGHPNLIHYCYSRCRPDGMFISRTRFRMPGFHRIDDPDESALAAVYQDTAFGIMTSGGVYRRDVAPGLRFSPDFPISPDRHFGWEFFRRCRNVFQIDKPLYIYYQYGDSVSHRLTDEAVEGLLRLDRIFWEEFQEHPMFPKAAKYGFRRLFPGVIGWHFDIVFGKNNGKVNFTEQYFTTLMAYLGKTGMEELGCLCKGLRFATKRKLPFLVRAYRMLVCRIWKPALANMRTFLALPIKKVARFLLAGLPGFALAVPLNFLLVDSVGLEKWMAYPLVLFIQVNIGFALCRWKVFRPSESKTLRQQYFEFLSAVVVVRIVDAAFYSVMVAKFPFDFVVSGRNCYYLVYQLLNVIVFSLVKFVFCRRAIEGERK